MGGASNYSRHLSNNISYNSGFGQVANGNNGILQPDHEILNETGQN